MIDFFSSFMNWSIPADPNDHRKPGHMPWGNSARILIDATCTITETATGKSQQFYLIAPCRKEWMYRDDELIQKPGGEYRVIFSQDRQVFVGRPMTETDERTASTSTDVFTSLRFDLNHYPHETVLATEEDIIKATQEGLLINARTELWNDERGLRAELEYPIRTMNFHTERKRFQVDTGPLIFPDLAAETEHWIDRCFLAHTVYNTFDWAEFVSSRPTPLMIDGKEVTQIFHYSDFQRVEAKHTLIAAV